MVEVNDQKRISYYMLMMILTGCFFFAMHLTFVGFTNDELYFLEYKKDFSSVIQIIVDRYITDCSRVLSEFLLFSFLEMPFIVWQVLDVVICLIIAHSLSVILVNDKNSKNNIYVFLFLASYPFMHVGSAGWICTTLNYLWPTAAVLYAISGLYRRNRGEKIYWWQYVLYYISLIFAANTEMSTVVVFFIFVLAMAFCIYEKRSKWYEISGILIGLAGIIFSLTAPGNGARTEMEAANWMPQFFDLSIFEKFRLCSVFVFEHFVAIPDVLFFLFALLIAFTGVRRGNGIKKNIIALCPLIIDIVYTVIYLFKYAYDVINNGRAITYDFTTPSIYINDSKTALIQYSELICFYLFIVTSVISLCYILPTIKEKLVCIVALGSGFAVRMALMLSPTMFVSWHRTLIYMYFSFIFVSFKLTKVCFAVAISDNGKSNILKKRMISLLLILGIIVNIILTVGLQIRKAG